MDYKEKYLKYKTKYINLKKNNQSGGGKNKKMELTEIIKNEKLLDKIYEKFWKNIYYNDAYIYYKNAYLFMKNTQNQKYHSFFSSIINKHLYTKKFPFEDIKNMKEWINLKESNYDAEIKDVENVSSLTIKIMDEIFEICPRIPDNIIVYRFETREENKIPNFKKNKLYNSSIYMSTTINPYYMIEKYFFLNTKRIKQNTIRIEYIIQIPKNAKGYYINVPYGPYNDISQEKIIGSQEYEILLPRNNIYIINDIKKENDIIFVSMSLYAEPKIIGDVNSNADVIFEKNDLTKEKYNFIKKIKPVKIKSTIRYNIYHELSDLFKNNYDPIMLNEITQAKRITKYITTDILEWNDKSKYNPIKHAISKEDLWYELLKWWLSKKIESIKIKKIYISVDMIYRGQSKPTINDNVFYKDVIKTIIDKKNIIKINYPILFNTKFDSTLYGKDIFILKQKYISNDETIYNNVYKIDDSYPRFVIIEIDINDSIDMIKLPYEYGLVINYDIEIKKINKVKIYDNTYGYYIYGNFQGF